MEGLRQRHCVASYDARIRLGSCAIAVVFVDRQRYTVELRTGVDGTLGVAQVKGRFNQAPSPEVQQRILDTIGLQCHMPSHTPLHRDPVVHQQAALDALRQVLPVLRAEQIDKIEVHFDGSGDSGMIEAPYFFRGSDLIDPEGVPSLDAIVPGTDKSLRDLLDVAFEDYLNSTGVNWYDSDGGFGTFQIDVATGHFEVDVNSRYTESTCEHFAEIELEEPHDQVA